MPPLAASHSRVKRLRRLTTRRPARDEERAFVLEGPRVVAEALAAGIALEAVYVGAGTSVEVMHVATERGVPVVELAKGVIERVADTVTPQPVVAVAPYLDVVLDALREATLVVVCVDVRDPGNAGTILRSAEASGVGGVICCDGAVDLYNPKTVRASAGALFHVPVVNGGDPVEVLERMRQWGLQRLGATARGGVPYTEADLRRPTALVLGNEAHGLSEAVAAGLDGTITVPMSGRAESLNVGMAATVLCFEAARQRQ